jgi:transcriptional regulator with XRE-family HTH domain
MYKEIFASRIKKARQEAGYTQQQVSNITGIPQSTITKYETGKLEPDIEKLGILAQFYNVSLNWLLGVSIEPPITQKK